MNQSHWLLCVARNCDWCRKIMPLSNLTQMASCGMRSYWIAKSTNLKEMLEKSSQFLSSEQPCKPKSLDVASNIAGIERICSENLYLRSTLEAIWFEFSMKGVLATVEICVLCALWFSNQFDIVSETPCICYTVGREL